MQGTKTVEGLAFTMQRTESLLQY